MKTFQIILTVSTLDSFDIESDRNLGDLKNEIASGKFQRDMLKDGRKEGVRKVQAIYRQIK